MGKNTKKKLKIAGKEKASRPKKVYKGNRNKERLRKLRKIDMVKKDWNGFS